MAKHTFSTTWKQTVSIDGADIMLHFRKMTVEQFMAWEPRYLEHQMPVGDDADRETVVARGNKLFDLIKETLTDFVSLPDDELEVDDAPVTTGAQLYAKFGTDAPLMFSLLTHVWLHHRFDEKTRKNLLSPSASPATSDAPAPEAAGKKPEPTAGNAESAGSVKTEAAVQEDALMVASSGATT